MASYPSSIYSPRDKENKSGVVYDAAKKTVIFAEDIEKDDDEIVAIETELGTNPKGAYASVKDFLADLLAKVISAFTDIPDVPSSYVGQSGKAVLVKATEDGLEFGAAGGAFNSRARAYRSINQSVNSGEWTKIALDVEDYDGNNEFAGGAFTAKAAGYYVVTGAATMNTSVDGKFLVVQVRKNGSAQATNRLHTGSAGNLIGACVSDIVYLAVNDYLELYVYHDSGVAKDFYGTSYFTYLAVHRIS
jgi:hypothetical protein